jgi:hypothetical protein
MGGHVRQDLTRSIPPKRKILLPRYGRSLCQISCTTNFPELWEPAL